MQTRALVKVMFFAVLVTVIASYVGASRAEAACNIAYWDDGHKEECYNIEECGLFVWCAETHCWVSGQELLNGCIPGISRECYPLGCWSAWWASCDGC